METEEDEEDIDLKDSTMRKLSILLNKDNRPDRKKARGANGHKELREEPEMT